MCAGVPQCVPGNDSDPTSEQMVKDIDVSRSVVPLNPAERTTLPRCNGELGQLFACAAEKILGEGSSELESATYQGPNVWVL